MISFDLIKEAVVVGIILIVTGYIASFLVKNIMPNPIANEHREACKVWNKYHSMEISLFFAGVIAHIGLELVGMNKWYCQNGVACLT
jgi:hypothetical protein